MDDNLILRLALPYATNMPFTVIPFTTIRDIKEAEQDLVTTIKEVITTRIFETVITINRTIITNSDNFSTPIPYTISPTIHK